MVATVSEPGSKEKSDRGKVKRPSHWAENRRVAIFPDVPGWRFRPEHSMVITTDQRRDIVGKVISAIFKRLNSREDKRDKRPGWLMTEP